MKSVICILVFLLPFCIATSSCGTISLSAEDSCVFPSNGLFKCFDVAHPSYVTASSGAVLSYNHDCVNVITGDTTGCIYQEDAQLLCLKATPDFVYSFSFTGTDSCDQSAVQSVTVSIPSSISGNIQCLDADTCISNCVEQCKETRFDLITESGVVAGYVILKNKLNWEVSAEIVTFQGTVQDRGWWMSGIVFTIGSKRTVKEWAFGNEQSRWFEVISFRDAFPGETVPCDSSVSVLVVAYVTNDKRNHNRVQERAYIGSCEVPSKRTFPLPPDVDCYRVDLPLCCECYIRTQSQNDWEGLCTLQTPSKRTGDNARVRNATCTRDQIWFTTENWCFVGGLQVGCSAGKTLTFTSPFALANYLADETTPRALARSYIDPPHASLGGLAAETAALALNLKLDECSADWSSSCYNLIHFGVCKHPNNPSRTACEPFWGLTVGDIFDLANNALGGCSQDDVNKLYTCVRYINRAFVDGKRLFETPDFKPEGCGVQITSGAVTSGSRITSGSVTSGSVTSGPVTSAAVTSSPITSAAVTSSPVTSSEATSSPITSAAVTSSPVTSSPVTSSPVTSSPITSAEVTSSPVTSSPVTSSPLTTSPLTTGEITTGEEIPSRRNF